MDELGERYFWLGFSVFPGVGPLRFKALLHVFGSAKNAWMAEPEALEKVIGAKFTEYFIVFRKTFSFEEYKKKLAAKKVLFLTLNDPGYPSLLKQIENPPFVLYVRGNSAVLNEENNYIGVVGTRKITAYGHTVTEMMTQSLVAAGPVIVSGLAMGVDAIAHQVTLVNGGKTIAVLGCGVDCCNPHSNQRLYDEIIAQNGAIVSEFPLSQNPTTGSFPSRNRIIAGLSHAILVTEGAEDSGALITATDAFKNMRKVFAVPGPITSSLSKGPYKLIEKGAKLIIRAEDILSDLGLNNGGFPNRIYQKKGETKDEQEVLDLLIREPLFADDIARQLEKNTATVSVLLSLMEMKGLIKNTDAGMFALN